MDYNRALVAAAEGKAILFTGAGFSIGATSLTNNPFPSGTKLAIDLCNDAKIPTTQDLKVASGRYLKVKTDEELIRLLKSVFTVKEIAEFQRSVAMIPWKAIYTTNYDNILEFGAASQGKKYTPLTLADDPRHFRNSQETVVHINGYIDGLNQSTLLNEFKLTNTSYLTTQFRESNWSEVFIRHIQAAHAVFFVGYSLYDLDIQEILFADQSLREKVFFIQRDDMTAEEIKFSELNDFGTILPIGVKRFSEDIESVDPLAISTDHSLILAGFDEMSTIPEEKHKTKDEDIFALLLKGQVNNTLLTEQVINGTDNDYIIARDAAVATSNRPFEAKNFTIVGDLGNGKSTLLRTISAIFIKNGYRCFWLKDESYDCYDEIEAIIGLDDPVVLVFDNYTRKLDLIAHANLKRKNNTILMFSARTSLHKSHEEDLYFKTIRIDLSKTQEIDCNKLSPTELSNLSEYFSKYGLWGDLAASHPDKKIRYLKHKCNSELHGVLLDLLASPEIQSRFSSFFNDIKQSKQYSQTVIAAFALNIINITQPTMHMIAAMTNDSSIFNPSFKANPAIKQFFNNERGIVTPKSSALAEFSLKNFPDTNLLVDSLINICKATRKKAEVTKFYWDIYRDLASFSIIQRMLPDHGKRELLIRFYEGLRSIDLERENPLFWLQYAMARLTFPDKGNLEQAHAYLKTALSFGRAKHGFTTVDIETQYARYHLEYAIHVATSANEAYDNFIKANDFLSQITKVELYKVEPFRPIRSYEPIFKKFGAAFNANQAMGMLNACNKILDNIKRLPPRTSDDKTVIAARKGLREIVVALDRQLGTTSK